MEEAETRDGKVSSGVHDRSQGRIHYRAADLRAYAFVGLLVEVIRSVTQTFLRLLLVPRDRKIVAPSINHGIIATPVLNMHQH